MADTKAAIRNKRNETFDINSGVRQGDALSALLFNLILHSAIGELNAAGTLSMKSSQIGAYADYVVIIGRSENAVREVFEELKEKLDTFY